MSQMLTNIKRVVEEEVSNRTSQMTVLFEAITNAIHANAKHIVCRLTSKEGLLGSEEETVIERRVDEIEIEDDGDGFGDANYKSFCEYRTAYKQSEFGCKGVGRFVFLKVFNKASYTSFLSEGQEKKTFTFSFDFDSECVACEDCDVSKNSTILSLSGVRSRYFDVNKHIDRRIEMDLDAIKKKVLLHLIPTLFFYKTKGSNVIVEFIDTDSNETVSITSDDIPEFEEKTFEVPISKDETASFTLYHKIIKGDGGLHAFYCASKRTVCEFSEKDFKISLPNGFSGYLLLESDYLDGHVDNERDDFDIFPIKTDLYSKLSWKDINAYLKSILSPIIAKNIPASNEINKNKLKDIQQERPYLVNYIEDEDLEIVGFVDKKQIIDKAKKRFDAAKDKLITHAGKDEYTDEELQDAIQIAQNELVAYIQDRVFIIERLKTMLNDKEKSEKVIHNLFMEKYTDDDYFSVGKNNLWLLDDRFTSYSYAASDKRIKEVLESMELGAGTESDGDKPDLALFFSHDPVNKRGLKSVLVELKSFDDGAKSDRDKYAGVQQLIDYIVAFQSKEEIKETWAFLVTDIDEKFGKRLVRNKYTPLFSTDRPIYHQYYDEIKTSIYVVGAKTLILDAEARNKVFIDIINKNSRLNDLICEKAEASLGGIL